MRNILSIENLNHVYHSLDGETSAIEQLSLTVKEGEFVCIVGPSGCGKSTLLSLISGLYPLQSGTLAVDGTVGYMLQKDHLFEWRSIYRNILLGLEIHHKVSPETKKRAIHLLEQYGLSDFADSKPSSLSGGMRQRVALIRTLLMEPDLLLLDEPFSALDYQTRLTVADEIGQIIRSEKRTALLVTHDLSEAISLGDRVIVLSSRPAKVKRELILTFPPEKSTPLERRNTQEFKVYFREVWRELNENA